MIKQTGNKIYQEWRKHVDLLATMNTTTGDPADHAPVLTEILTLANRYCRAYGKNIALHVIR